MYFTLEIADNTQNSKIVQLLYQITAFGMSCSAKSHQLLLYSARHNFGEHCEFLRIWLNLLDLHWILELQ